MYKATIKQVSNGFIVKETGRQKPKTEGTGVTREFFGLIPNHHPMEMEKLSVFVNIADATVYIDLEVGRQLEIQNNNRKETAK